MEESFFYYLIGVPVLGMLAQWLGWRVRLPAILLLLAFGIGLGELFGLDPDRILRDVAQSGADIGPALLFPLISISVAIILFEGGLSLRFSELRNTASAVFRLITVAVFISWILTALLAWWLFDFNDARSAALIGAVLVVTGPTVVAPLLRHIRPHRSVSSIIKWEGIVVDPIGALLAVLVFEFTIATGGETGSIVEMATALFKCVIIAPAIGWAAAAFLIEVVKRFWIPDFLHTVGFLATMLLSFALANWIHHESGLVTVTVLGIILANQKTISITHIIEFKESLGVFLISCLFIVLGSRLRLEDIGDLGPRGLLFLLLLILLVRPVSVLLSTIRTRLPMRERVFVSFLAPRGIIAAAVTAVFALKIRHLAQDNPELGGLAADAEKLVPIAFLVIVGTVTIYGLGAAPLARRLKLADDKPQGILFGGASELVRQIAMAVHQCGFSVLLVDTNYQHVSAARQKGLPADCSSLLSEHAYEEIDLSGIGRLAALTPSDEVNAMATSEFKHLFGRANVFRLSTSQSRSRTRSTTNRLSHARVLFHESANYNHLSASIETGWRVKTTKLTEEFDMDDFRALYGDAAMPLFVVESPKTLTVITADQPASPKPGQTLIALVDPRKAQAN